MSMTDKRPRSPNGINLHRFLEEFSVKVMPCRAARKPRPANVIYGGRTISRLMRKNIGHCRTVILAIQASDSTCFDECVIWAVWRFVTAHVADWPRADVVSRFSRIDLSALNRRAHRLAAGQTGRMGKTSEKLATLLAFEFLEQEEAA